MTEISKQLQQARPSIVAGAPLASRIVMGFGVFNTLLGSGFYLLKTPSTLVIVNDIFSFKFWGFIYIFIGLSHLWSLWRRSWVGVRRSLLSGVLVKSLFWVALIIQSVRHPVESLSILFIWTFIVYMQAVTYAYLAPVSDTIESFEKEVKNA